MSEEKWIYKLSEYQIGVLGSYFKYMDAPTPHVISVENIMLVEGGDMIVDVLQYGRLCRNRVPQNPAEEKIPDGYLKNFMMCIPNDIERHKDGSPVLFIDPEHKKMFINWAFAQKIDLESMDVKQREELFKEWKNSYNPPEITREWITKPDR